MYDEYHFINGRDVAMNSELNVSFVSNGSTLIDDTTLPVLYTLPPKRKAKNDTAYLSVSLIIQIHNITNVVRCGDCGKFLSEFKKLKAHYLTCNKGIAQIEYVDGNYQPKANVFEDLESVGITVPKNNRFFPYFLFYDFETYLLETPTKDETTGLQYEGEHQLLSISIIIQMDTDSMYLALSDTSFDKLVKPELMVEYQAKKQTWFGRKDTAENEMFDRRTPGLFKMEYSGTGIIALSSKMYYAFGEKDKMSSKGLNKKQNDLTKERYLAALHGDSSQIFKNRGFRVKDNKMTTYSMNKYGMRIFNDKLKRVGFNTFPIDI
jgi:hypothetical protein